MEFAVGALSLKLPIKMDFVGGSHCRYRLCGLKGLREKTQKTWDCREQTGNLGVQLFVDAIELTGGFFGIVYVKFMRLSKVKNSTFCQPNDPTVLNAKTSKKYQLIVKSAGL
jgi:hypothetical protein